MYKKESLQIAIIFAGLTLISGCAPIISGVMNSTIDDKVVVEKTAKYFGTSSEQVTVSSFEKGTFTTSYHAKYAGKSYNCSINYGEVNCKQPGGQDNAQPDPGMTVGSGKYLGAQAVNENYAAMSPSQAQTRLNQLGYSVGTPDGIFGKKSVEKLKLFQKSRGLPMTGKLDDATVEALR